MGTFIEKRLGFYQVREELEARISELEDENENLTDENTRLLASKEWLTKEKTELTEKNKTLTTEKDNLTKANAELKKENDKLNHQVIALIKEQDSLKYERAQLQDAHGSLKELCTNSEKDNQRLADKLKKLENAQKNLENSNDQLLQAREKIAEIYMNKNGRYCLLSIGGDVDTDGLEKYENPTIVEFRNKEKFLKAYNALSHRPFTECNDMEVAHEAQKYFTSTKGNDLYRFFSKLKQWAGADEKQNFRDLVGDFSLESFAHCTDFNPIEIYAYYIGRCINNMHNGVFLKYFLSYPIKYEKHQAEKIRESFEKGLKKSLPRHVFDDEKTAKNFKVELRASEPCVYAISTLKSYGFDKSAKLDKPIYYGVFDFGGGKTDFNFGKWEKSANPKFAYKMTHFSSRGDKYLGGENLLELLAFEAYAQNFQTLKEKDIVIAKPNYDGINEQRFGSFMQKSKEACLNLQTIASKLCGFLENLDAHRLEAIEENEEFEIKGFTKDFKAMLFDRNGKEVEEIELKIDCKELLELLKSKIDDGVANFFAGFSKVMAENIDNQCRAFHNFLRSECEQIGAGQTSV